MSERGDNTAGGGGALSGGGENVESGNQELPVAPSASRLAVSLEGRLPCVYCRYDLRGVSILGVCPECGTAVRATLLAVVDPLATELRPINRPVAVGVGLLAWVGLLCVAAVLVGGDLIRQILAAWHMGEPTAAPGWTAWAVAILVGCAGVGAAMLVKPHDVVARRDTVLAWVGVVLHLPLAASGVLLFDLHPSGWGSRSGASALGPLAVIWEPSSERTMLRMLACVAGLGIIVCMRPIARVLVARSLAIRTGRVDRQTMLATATAIVVVMAGDALGLAARWNDSSLSEWMMLGAVTLLGFGALLLCIGLFSSLVDVVRIARAIIKPGPTMQQVLNGERGPASGHERGGDGGGAR